MLQLWLALLLLTALPPWAFADIAQLDPAAPITVVLQHAGSCQPSCEEEKDVEVHPDIPYRAHLEVVQADMRSHSELVEVELGSTLRPCHPRPKSDYDCSWWECSEWYYGFVGESKLHVKARGWRTRDTCKCIAGDANTDMECFSALLSGTAASYGLTVRLTLTPAVAATWTIGPWGSCDAGSCANLSEVSQRMVQCSLDKLNATKSDSVEQGALSSQISCDTPPAETRVCAKDPECVAELRPCPACFYLAHLAETVGFWRAPEAARFFNITIGTGRAILWSIEKEGSRYVRLRICREEELYLMMQWSNSTNHVEGMLWQLTLGGRAELNDEDIMENSLWRSKFVVQQRSTSEFSLHDAVGGDAIKAQAEGAEIHREDTLQLIAAVSETPEGDMEVCKLANLASTESHACRLASGWFCPKYAESQTLSAPCDLQGLGEDAEQCFRWSCDSLGVALLTDGQQCADIGCAPLRDQEECTPAAHLFGLSASPDQAMLTSSSGLPTACSFEAAAGDAPGAFWFNSMDTAIKSSSSVQQLCRCGPCQSLGSSYKWKVGEWGPCSMECSSQRRHRDVLCLARQTGGGLRWEQVQADACRAAGLREPASDEPCVTSVCFGTQAHTRCLGEARQLVSKDLLAWLGPLGAKLDQNRRHCVQLSVGHTAATCRHACISIGHCVGFTYYDDLSSRSGSRCCFLRSVTRWQPKFYHATCHLAHGGRTHSGCSCQVSWTRMPGSHHQEACGPEFGGCCITPDSGALPWCPTTSSSCGKHLVAQQRWDFCDVPGLPVATITQGTCPEHNNSLGARCDHVYDLSTCSQLAAALGLPDTVPEVVSVIYAPFGCLWHSTTSQLWLGEIFDTRNISEQVRSTYVSSWMLPEICFCPSETFHWEVGEWTSCFQDTNTSCGSLKRTRRVFCLRRTTFGNEGQGQVVEDALCLAEMGVPPQAEEKCSDCSISVHVASLELSVASQDSSQYTSDTLHEICGNDLAQAMSISPADRLTLEVSSCCDQSVLQARLLISDVKNGQDIRAGDALLRLMRLARSSSLFNSESWSETCRSLAQQMMVSIDGEYQWHVLGDWSHCSVLCDTGVETREVECFFHDHQGPPVRAASASSCDAASKPAYQRTCGHQPCRGCSGFALSRHYTFWGGVQQMQHGSVVYYTCAEGYSSADDVAADSSSRCEDGDWIAVELSCGRSCADYVSDGSMNAVHGDGLKHGSLRHVMCSQAAALPPSFEVPTSATSLCDDGVWSAPDLPCSGYCQVPAEHARGTVTSGGESMKETYLPAGTSRELSCGPGFTNIAGNQEPLRLRCMDGEWRKAEELDFLCKADCPRYVVAKGLVVIDGDDLSYVHTGSRGALVEASASHEIWPPWMLDDAGQPNFGSTIAPGVRHGTKLHLQCAKDHSQVPRADQEIRCEDGQWSSLYLDCRKDCDALDQASLTSDGYIVVASDLRDAGLALWDEPWRAPDKAEEVKQAPVLHGSSVTVVCAHTREMHGHIRCEDGVWIGPKLQCFASCPARKMGAGYSTALVGAQVDVLEGAPHGAKLLVACAEGHSPFDSTSSVSEAKVLDMIECVSGQWTERELQCHQDCPPVELPRDFTVQGHGVKLNAARYVSCTGENSKGLTLRCLSGLWYVINDQSDSRITLFNPEQVPLNCKDSPTGFDALTPLEKALLWTLVGTCCCTVLGFIIVALMIFPLPCFWRDERQYMSQSDLLRDLDLAAGDLRWAGMSGQARGSDSSEAPVTIGAACEDINSIFSLASAPSRNISTGSASRDGGGSAQAVASAMRQQCYFPKCSAEATHFCFPCVHRCLCKYHAETLVKWAMPGAARSTCPMCKQPVDYAIDSEPSSLFSGRRRANRFWPLAWLRWDPV